MNNKSLITILQVIVGNIIFALTVKLFLIPGNIVTAGATGIALACHHFFNTSISGVLLIFNIAALIVGLWLLGKNFFLTTILSSFAYPIALEFFDRVLGNYVPTNDIMLGTIFSGLGMGISLGLVIRAGSSTGGMDVAPLVLHKFAHVPVSVGMYLFDILILGIQIFWHPIEQSLYGIVLIFIYTFILDKVMLLGTTKTELKVVSKYNRKICNAILEYGNRGVTLISAEGGYLHEPTEMVYSVISNRELPKIEKLIHDIDPECFMVVTRVNEVKGRGFTLQKESLENKTKGNV